MKQDKATSNPKTLINLSIVYKLDVWSRDLYRKLTLGDCLFGAIKLIKNDDPDKYGQSSHGIEFDASSQFFHQVVSRVKMLLV